MMDKRHWDVQADALDRMIDHTRKEVRTDVSFLAFVLKRLGDHIFAEQKEEKPAHRFEPGDRVRTLCRGAVPGTAIMEGEVGTVRGYDSANCPLVVFDGDVTPPKAHYCYEAQLELVPEKQRKKPDFYPGDLVRVENASGGVYITRGRAYVVLSFDRTRSPRRGGMVSIWDDEEEANFLCADRFTLVAPGPNHPKQDC